MNLLTWKRKKTKRSDLSAYIDGELDAHRTAALSEALVFNPRLQIEARNLEQISALANAALAPVATPDADAFAKQVLHEVGLPAAAPRPSATRRRLKPAVVASVGLLVTAGITFAGLRRRGLV